MPPRPRLTAEVLEDRTTPATLFGLTNANALLRFDSATPGTVTSTAITGLQATEQVVGIDVRPATGQLYAFGLVDDGATRTGRIYTINPTTGAATQVGSTPWTTAYPDTEFGGFNFNPNVDLIRIISRTGPNFRVNPVTGALVGTDTNTSAIGLNGVAYTNNDGFSPTTTLYGLNFDQNQLVTVGGLNGTPSPNGGQVNVVGGLGTVANDAWAFEIVSSGGVTTAFATDDGNLRTVNLTTGQTTFVGAIGGNPSLLGLTAALSTITVGGTTGNDTVVVNATNGNSGSYTLNGGTPVAFSGITSFSFLGGNGDDTLTINHPAGNNFAPTGGIVFHGGAGTANTLVNAGGSSAGGSLTATSATDGTLTQSGPSGTQTVTFTGLAAVTDTAGSGGFIVNGTAAADTINVVNGPAGRLQVNSGATPTFVTVNVAGKAVVRVDAGGGSNTVTLNFTQAAGILGSLVVIGGPVADTFTVQSTALPTELRGGDGDDRFDIVPTAFPVTVNGGPGTDELNNDITGATDPFFTIAADPAGGLMGGITYSNRGAQTFAQVEPAPTPFNFLTVTATDGLTTTPAGSTVTYTVVVRNNSPIGITGIAASATFPTQLTGVTWTAAYTGTGSSGAAGGTGNIAQSVNLAAGGTVTYTVTGTLDPAFTGPFTAVASAATPVPADLLDVTPADNTATDTTTVAATTSTLLGVSGPADGTARLFEPSSLGVYAAAPDAANPATFPGVTVRSAVGDVNGDGLEDTILVTGPGGPIRVAVRSGLDAGFLVAPFDPFGGDFAGGGFVAAADLDGDGRAEFVVTPDEGGGPRVSVFSLNTDGSNTVRANFLGIDDAAFRGGARAALGDVNGDGVTDLVVSAGFGGGPRTAIFGGPSVLAGSPTRLVGDFFAFPGSDATNLRNGSFVAAGDVTGDGFADLIFGGGPGGAPRVFVLSGARVIAGNVGGAQAAPVANFFVAGNADDRGGVRVAVADVDGDGRGDLITGSGPNQPARVRVYAGASLGGGGEPPALLDLAPFNGTIFEGGVYVG